MYRSGQKFALRSAPLHKPSESPPPVHFRSSLLHQEPVQVQMQKSYKDNYFKPRCPSRVRNIQGIKKSPSAPVKVNYNQYPYDFYELMMSKPKLCVYGQKPFSQNVFRKPSLPKRPQSAPPSRSRYTKENPQIIRSKFKVKPNIYREPVIVYNGKIHPLPTTDIQPVPSDVLVRPQQVLQYTVDESYLKTIDFNNQNRNNKRYSTNNNNNNPIEDDVIVEDIDEEDFDNILPMCNRIIYDENMFNNTQIQSPSKPHRERPNSARPSSARRRKYIDNNDNSHRPQSAIPIVIPHKQKRLADTLTNIKITNETKDPDAFISKLTDAVFTPIGVNNMPLNNDLLKAEEFDNIPSPWVIEHYAY